MNAETLTDQTRMPEGGHADGAINANDQSCSGWLGDSSRCSELR